MKDRYYIFVYSAAIAFFAWDTLVKIVVEVKRRRQKKENISNYFMREDV